MTATTSTPAERADWLERCTEHFVAVGNYARVDAERSAALCLGLYGMALSPQEAADRELSAED